MDAFLTKPCSKATLATLVDRFVDDTTRGQSLADNDPPVFGGMSAG